VLLVIAGLMLLQAAWILTIPPFRGIDEIDHTYRAASVARGQWTAGPQAEDGRGEQVSVPAAIVDAAHAQCEGLHYTGPENCNAISTNDDGSVVIASSAGSYYPPFYWVVGTAGSPFDGAAALYAMRIAAALLCLAFFGLTTWSLRHLPGRWPLAALVLAATPVLIYSTTVVAPNGLEMSAALTLWASLLALVHRPVDSARLLWVAIVAATVLGSLRALGPVFILLIVGTIAVLNPRGLWAAIRSHPRTIALGCALVGIAVALFAAWTLGPVSSVLEEDELEGPPGFKPINLVLWSMQSIAAFPFRNQMGPWIVYPVVGTLVMLLFVFAFRGASRRERAVLSLAAATAYAIPLVFTLATLDTVGDIWQGRYGLPYGVGAVLMAGWMIGRRHASHPLRWWLTALAGAFYSVAVSACLIKVRANELDDNRASIADPAWPTPSPVLLAVLVVAATTMFVVGLAQGSRGSVARRDVLESARPRRPVL